MLQIHIYVFGIEMVKENAMNYHCRAGTPKSFMVQLDGTHHSGDQGLSLVSKLGSQNR